MDAIKNAIQSAYEAQIRQLYNTFSKSLIHAQGDETKITKAKEKLKSGLEYINYIHKLATEVTNNVRYNPAPYPELKNIHDLENELPRIPECPICSGNCSCDKDNN